MTKEEMEIFEKLIITNSLYTENLVKTNETIKQIAESLNLVNKNLNELNDYLRQTGSNNFQGIIGETVLKAVNESNKPLYNFIRILALLITLIGAIIGLIKLFL